MDGGGRLAGPLGAGPPGSTRGSTWGSGRDSGRAPGHASPVGALLARIARARPAPHRPRGSRFVARGRGRRVPAHLGSALAVAFLGGAVGIGIGAGGHADAFVAAHGRPLDVLGRALGFGLDTVTIEGLAQLRSGEILRYAGLDAHASLAFLSVGEVRDRLQAVPLIGEASVRKLYPHELVISLVEREPAALWQKDGELTVVAADGTVIDEMQDGRFAGLPLVVGEGANRRLKEYLALVEAAGPLKGRIRAGTLVSGRRWTLKLDGIDVRLPEEGALAAMARLVRLETESRISEKDVIAVDLRLPDRAVVRLTEEAAAGRTEAVKKRLARGKGVEI